MDEKKITAYIQSIKNYFTTFAKELPEVGVPYIAKSNSELMEYTGSLSITGKCRGAVYITMGNEMLEKIAIELLDQKVVSESDKKDVIGEMSNTITGDGCSKIVDDFNVSVPIVISGSNHSVDLPKLKSPIYVVPFTWMGFKSYLYLGFDLNMLVDVSKE